MALPSQLIYNDLDGEEIRHVLEERFKRLLSEVSYLRRHLTLPRVRMTMQIHLDVWADQPTPERHTIEDNVLLRRPDDVVERDNQTSLYLTDTVSAAPGGQPPDKVREDHGLPVPTPTRGVLAVEDTRATSVDGRRVTMDNGVVIDRTGKAQERANATVVVQDFGRAGLAEGTFNRTTVVTRGTRDGLPVKPPAFREDD